MWQYQLENLLKLNIEQENETKSQEKQNNVYTVWAGLMLGKRYRR